MSFTSQTIWQSCPPDRPIATGGELLIDGVVWLLALLLSVISVLGGLFVRSIGFVLWCCTRLSVYAVLILFFALLGILLAGLCIISLGTISLS